MKILKSKRFLVTVLVCLAVAFSAITIMSTQFTSQAAFPGHSSHLTREQLHNLTLAATVSTDVPTVTVLTHGLGGGARDWSNSMHYDSGNNWIGSSSFVYDSNSIIEKIRSNISSGIKLYRANMPFSFNVTGLELYNEYTTNNPITYINDFSQHTVIVIDSSGTKNKTLDQLYEELDYIIDKVAYDFLTIMGCLPRLNLIGHSLGGLVNMRYAISHPKNVASLVSLGTPYNGSWYDNGFVEFIGIDDFHSTAGSCITGSCGHSNDFCDLTSRKNSWNNVYAQNMHINFHALSGETSYSIMHHIIWDDNHLETHIGESEAVGIRIAYVLAIPFPIYLEFLPGDVCVDTNSQKAAGYSGATNYNKNFTSSNSDCGKRAQNDFPVPHNLETYDSDMHNYIFSKVVFGEPFSTDSTGGTITRVNISLGAITIPSQINGTTITSIGERAFSGQTSLIRVTVPAGITSIGDYAFLGCGNMESIIFPAGIKDIGRYAFETCYALSVYSLETSSFPPWSSSVLWNPVFRPVYLYSTTPKHESWRYVSNVPTAWDMTGTLYSITYLDGGGGAFSGTH